VPTPRFLVAPDAFKGTMTAGEVAAALARGLLAGGAEAVERPVADGGEGTIDVLLGSLDGASQHHASCTDPLGRPIQARWVWLAGSATAIVEMAAASGLVLVAEVERDAEAASSAGTGELLLAARDAGARETILAIGGTATSDGGVGALEAISNGGGLGDMRLTLACDVSIPFERAAEVFGPQKGASAADVVRLTRRLVALASELPRDPRGLPMTGAGGGLAGAMWAVHGAELRSGAAYVLETLGFERLLDGADAVVIGEGCLDGQSRHGKIGGAIMALAQARRLPVHAVVGSQDSDAVRAEWGALASLQVAGSVARLEDAGERLSAF
jgi:glycerate 2-kinase